MRRERTTPVWQHMKPGAIRAVCVSCQRPLWRHGPTEPVLRITDGIGEIPAEKHVDCDLPEGYLPARDRDR